MPFAAYFDSPTSYRNKFDFYDVGSSPLLARKLIEYLDAHADEIREITLAFYIFNNELLNTKLTQLANLGIRVTVITMPMEGYDANKPQEIIGANTYEHRTTATKYDLARRIFGPHYQHPVPNFEVRFFPHMFIRSPRIKQFARGEMPYSLHTKSFLIKLRNGRGVVGISSSNFAVRDLVKEENLLLIEDEPGYAESLGAFLNTLAAASIPLTEFDFKKDYTSFPVQIVESPAPGLSGFIAPFYFNSGFIAEDALNTFLATAEREITIIGQHVCPVSYSFEGAFHSMYTAGNPTRNGLLETILSKAAAGVQVSIGSQTFVADPPIISSASFRKPLNTASFITFFNAIRNQPNISYFVNENIHSKYIIVDDKVFISSFNYTPTQFIYLDKVDIPTLDNNPSLSYSGIYSETGHYVIVDDTGVAAAYRANAGDLAARNGSVRVQ
jgi:phosphatidylserine/phosphatidylglycerophosphate/cardiolipin synthase-like enzyme